MHNGLTRHMPSTIDQQTSFSLWITGLAGSGGQAGSQNGPIYADSQSLQQKVAKLQWFFGRGDMLDLCFSHLSQRTVSKCIFNHICICLPCSFGWVEATYATLSKGGPSSAQWKQIMAKPCIHKPWVNKKPNIHPYVSFDASSLSVFKHLE